MSKGPTGRRMRDKYKQKGRPSIDGAPGPELISACEKEGLDPSDWQVYFGDVEPRKAGCDDCFEHRNGLCAGGVDPIKCLRDDRRAEMRLRTSR